MKDLKPTKSDWFKSVDDMTDDEKMICLNTIHDTSLQNENNPFWWICFDLTEQKKLFGFIYPE